VEQDGLIRRIMEINRMRSAFPHLPRAYHAGLYGYNRQPHYLKMKYEQKLALVKDVCFDKVKMRQYAQSEEYYLDSVPCELDTDFEELRLKY
jgi:hypothetical protein